VIVLGGGHNGLILAAYLGKAGMKTLTIERVEGFQYNLLAPLFALHLNLHEPPR
jgi:2-polyprenyl-6-methoxyphenol hydroxylase-like FAD-dependent oxidoreductase